LCDETTRSAFSFYLLMVGSFRMILCECGEFVDGCTFKDFIETSANPSTPTIGHRNCGLIFNFIDGSMPKKFSSRAQLKSLAMKLAEKYDLDNDALGRLLLAVDRLKTSGKLSDGEILITALKEVLMSRED
jgi:hypothetical protein